MQKAQNYFSGSISNVCYFVSKIVLTYCEKNCSNDGEKVLKFEAEGREFAKQFVSIRKGQNNFW